MFTSDGGGHALSLPDCKVTFSSGGIVYKTKLWGLLKNPDKKVFICTYSLPDIKYIFDTLDFRGSGKNVFIFCNSKFRDQAEAIKIGFPDIKIFLTPRMHAKMILIEPETVWLSSQNFGNSHWCEFALGTHSRELYDTLLSSLKFVMTNKTNIHADGDVVERL